MGDQTLTDFIENYKPVIGVQKGSKGLLYHEYSPHTLLRNHVQCYWILRSTSCESVSYPVIPDGCVDFVFDMNDVSPSGIVVGLMQKPAIRSTSSRRSENESFFESDAELLQ